MGEKDKMQELETRIEMLENSLIDLANRVADDHVSGNDIIAILLKNGFKINQGGAFKWQKNNLI